MKRILVTALAIVFGLLVLTNPTKEDFKNWTMQQGESASDVDSAKPATTAMINAFASVLLDSTAIRSNYIIFSTYTSSANDQFLAVGVFGNFLDLSPKQTNHATTPLFD